jgi:hypothetical protein
MSSFISVSLYAYMCRVFSRDASSVLYVDHNNNNNNTNVTLGINIENENFTVLMMKIY